MATAFCGVCAGCASEINANSESKNDNAPIATIATDEQYKVILCPGNYYSGNTVTQNAVGTGATKLAAADEEAYFVSNAYFATVAAGADLPVATTTRAETTFQGWTYAENGVVKKVAQMPASLDGNLYLYASWKTEGNIQINPNPNPNPNPGPTPTPGESYAQIGSNKYTLSRNQGNTTREEYWLGGSKIELTVGNTISLYMDGQKISAYIERNSSGVDLGDESQEYDTFNVNLSGSFVIWLHKNEGNWSVQFVVTTAVTETTVSIPASAKCANITFANGSVKLYIKDGNNYASNLSGYYLHMWDGSTKYFGEWGAATSKMSETMNAANYNINADVGFIVHNNNGKQTRDLAGLEAGGTYLVTYATGAAGKVERIRVA